jgi:murein L,D-transpeptidase YcbB/YkuD
LEAAQRGTGRKAEPDHNRTASVRALFADMGVRVGATAADFEAVLRRFHAWVGLPVDGVAGPRTVHLLARYAREARELRGFELTAA